MNGTQTPTLAAPPNPQSRASAAACVWTYRPPAASDQGVPLLPVNATHPNVQPSWNLTRNRINSYYLSGCIVRISDKATLEWLCQPSGQATAISVVHSSNISFSAPSKPSSSSSHVCPKPDACTSTNIDASVTPLLLLNGCIRPSLVYPTNACVYLYFHVTVYTSISFNPEIKCSIYSENLQGAIDPSLGITPAILDNILGKFSSFEDTVSNVISSDHQIGSNHNINMIITITVPVFILLMLGAVIVLVIRYKQKQSGTCHQVPTVLEEDISKSFSSDTIAQDSGINSDYFSLPSESSPLNMNLHGIILVPLPPGDATFLTDISLQALADAWDSQFLSLEHACNQLACNFNPILPSISDTRTDRALLMTTIMSQIWSILSRQNSVLLQVSTESKDYLAYSMANQLLVILSRVAAAFPSYSLMGIPAGATFQRQFMISYNYTTGVVNDNTTTMIVRDMVFPGWFDEIRKRAIIKCRVLIR